jgi:hypothetical protein
MLKKWSFLILCAIAGASAHAQFSKGDRMVGASIASLLYNSGHADVSFPSVPGYSSQTTSYGIRIEPVAGWFISGNTAIGGSLVIHPFGQKVTYEDNGTTFQEDKSNNFDIGLGAFARYYIDDSGNFLPYGQLGFNAGISSASTEGFRYYSGPPDRKETYDGESSGGFFTNASFQIGLTKMLNNQVGLDLFAGYTYSYNKNTFTTNTQTDVGLDGTIDLRSENETTTKFTNHGFIIGVGLQVFLTKKK